MVTLQKSSSKLRELEKLLKLSELRGIAKKNCNGNFKELSKIFKENHRNVKYGWKI